MRAADAATLPSCAFLAPPSCLFFFFPLFPATSSNCNTKSGPPSLVLEGSNFVPPRARGLSPKPCGLFSEMCRAVRNVAKCDNNRLGCSALCDAFISLCVFCFFFSPRIFLSPIHAVPVRSPSPTLSHAGLGKSTTRGRLATPAEGGGWRHGRLARSALQRSSARRVRSEGAALVPSRSASGIDCRHESRVDGELDPTPRRKSICDRLKASVIVALCNVIV